MYRVLDPRQSIIDVTVQELGSVEQLFALLDVNGLDVNADLFAGKELTIPNVSLTNRQRDAVRYFKQNKLSCINTFQAATSNVPPEDFDERDFSDNDFFA